MVVGEGKSERGLDRGVRKRDGIGIEKGKVMAVCACLCVCAGGEGWGEGESQEWAIHHPSSRISSQLQSMQW